MQPPKPHAQDIIGNKRSLTAMLYSLADRLEEQQTEDRGTDYAGGVHSELTRQLGRFDNTLAELYKQNGRP